MLQNLTGWHALVILAIVLLVFGSTKLPALAKSVGQSMRILKHEVHDESSPTHGVTAASPVSGYDTTMPTDIGTTVVAHGRS